MQQRLFGGAISVSVLGVGCGRVGSISNTVPMREVLATLEASVDAGINLFDTADVYGQGDSERILGRLRIRHKNRLFVITKVGLVHGRFASAIRLAKPLLRALVRARPQPRNVALQARGQLVRSDFTVSYLRRAIEGSLRRLRADVLDGLLLHNPTPEVLANLEIHEFLDSLIREGKAAHVGISANSMQDVEAAMKIPSVKMLEVPASVAVSLADSVLAEQLQRRNIGVFVRSVLRPPDSSPEHPFSPRESLAAVLRQKFVTAAIVGVSTRRHLDELLSVGS